MTINGFSSFQSKKLNVKGSCKVDEISGSSVAFDVYLTVCQARATCLQRIVNETMINSGKDWFSLVQQATLNLFFDRLCNYLSYGWFPIFCFEADEPHPLRSVVRARREKEREKLLEKIEQAKTDMESDDILISQSGTTNYVKYLRQDVINGAYAIVNTIYNILSTCGFVVVKPEMMFFGNYSSDDESVVAALVRHDLVNFGYTTDTDCHAYGASNCITEIDDYNKTIVFRSLEEMLNTMEVDFFQFQLTCILAGVDYNDNIPGIAFTKALKLVKENKITQEEVYILQLLQMFRDIQNSEDEILEQEDVVLYLQIPEVDLEDILKKYKLKLCGSDFKKKFPNFMTKNALVKSLNHPNINFWQVYPIFRCTEFIKDISLDLKPELWKKHAFHIFTNNGLDTQMTKIRKLIPEFSEMDTEFALEMNFEKMEI